jgi:hypothetical protein
MAYPIEVPVESGGRLLVEACEADLPSGLELAARGPGEIVAKRTAEVHFTDTLTWKRTGPDAGTAKAAGDAWH